MNIVNDTSSSLKFELNTEILGNNPVTINASYQHATYTSITKDEAKSMKFGTSAGSGKTLLGGTLIFNTSIANKYDKMGGVSVVYNPFDL